MPWLAVLGKGSFFIGVGDIFQDFLPNSATGKEPGVSKNKRCFKGLDDWSLLGKAVIMNCLPGTYVPGLWNPSSF